MRLCQVRPPHDDPCGGRRRTLPHSKHGQPPRVDGVLHTPSCFQHPLRLASPVRSEGVQFIIRLRTGSVNERAPQHGVLAVVVDNQASVPLCHDDPPGASLHIDSRRVTMATQRPQCAHRARLWVNHDPNQLELTAECCSRLEPLLPHCFPCQLGRLLLPSCLVSSPRLALHT
jgi:hypothetical protein